MFQLNYNLKILDLHYAFIGAENVALIVLILVIASGLLNKTKLIEEKYKGISKVFVVLLVAAIAVIYATELYGYLHTTRPSYVELNQQAQNGNSGLSSEIRLHPLKH
jgi:ethanolamine transporter EutH